MQMKHLSDNDSENSEPLDEPPKERQQLMRISFDGQNYGIPADLVAAI